MPTEIGPKTENLPTEIGAKNEKMPTEIRVKVLVKKSGQKKFLSRLSIFKSRLHRFV